jgi:exopolyphosphatase/guanosine-5'-triphosphate,3'-diphosphate pyrophosphatase
VEQLCDELRRLPARERAELPGLNDERADIILAGALVLRQVLRLSKAECLQVSGQGLREGLFYEQFLLGLEPPLIGNLRGFGVENLLRSYDYQPLHVAKVQELALEMFDQLSPLHGYGQWERELLWAAAMLHDIGVRVNYYDHHKHSSYIILNSAIGGYNHRELAIIALLARFHRKGMVDTGELRDVLGDGDAERVAKLAALLRIAETLDRSKSQVVGGVRCVINGGVRIVCDTVGDAALEIWDANRRAALFRRAYGVEAVIE